jgi:hypothetical protein
MKKLMLIAMIATASWNCALAQGHPEKREAHLAAFRAEIFTRVLRLTPEEAQGFWPAYNEYLDRRNQIQQEYKPNKQEDQMSDAEVEAQIKHYFEKKQRDMDLEKDFYQKIRMVLPLRKVAKIPLAERNFRESLVKNTREKHPKKPQERRPDHGGRH